MIRRPVTRATAAAALAAAALAPAASAQAAPRVHQLVVFKSGKAKQRDTGTGGVKVRVGRKRCAVGKALPLAALVRSHAGALKLHDYGACSKRPADAAGLYVRSIAGERARGPNGWVYKVGHRVAPAGAADPSGPFGRGRLHAGARITWFYCHMKQSGCQRTLGVKTKALGGGKLQVTVRGYDDRGRGRLTRGATVHAGDQTAKTNAAGRATLAPGAGRARVWAARKSLVRSFEEAVDVR